MLIVNMYAYTTEMKNPYNLGFRGGEREGKLNANVFAIEWTPKSKISLFISIEEHCTTYYHSNVKRQTQRL